MAEKSISQLRNLGPATERMLAEIGVATSADLRELGSVEAFHKLRFVFGKRVSLNALYAMEAAILECDWRLLSADDKIKLRNAAFAA
jgi:DNA transformation protein